MARSRTPGQPSGASFFRALIEQTSDIVSVVDDVGVLLYCSPSVEVILGHPAESLLGTNVFDLVHEDDREALFARFRAATAGPGRTTTDDYRCHHLDGSWRTFQAIATNLLGDPSVEGVVVSARDVTQRRQLEERHAELELLYQTAPVGLSVVDRDLRFVRINDELAAMDGLAPAAHVGRSARDVIPELASTLEPIFRGVLETGVPVLNLEVHGSTPAAPGVEKDWLVNYYRLEDPRGRPIGVSSVVQEITERKQAERALEARVQERTAELRQLNEALRGQIAERLRAEESLRRSEEQYRNLVENISEALFTVDGEGRITYVSPALARMTGGRTPEEVIGHSFLDFVHPDDAGELVQSFAEAMGGRAAPSEYRVIGKDGGIYWLRSHSKAVVQDGRIVSVQGVLADVTERRRAEMEAQQRRAELAHVQRLTTAGEMTAEISHQLNQPLAAIVNFADGLAMQLREGQPPPAAMGRVARRIADEARRASALIRQMRNFLRKEEGPARPTDLNRLVKRVYGLLAEEFRRDGIEARFVLAASLPLWPGNAVLVEQVILNLVRNAMEAMTPPGKDCRLEVATRAAERSVSLTVRDSGIGLPEGAEGKIFDAFFTTKPGGLGLGLSVSRSIVEANGGRLWARRNDGQGTTVGFDLPLGPA